MKNHLIILLFSSLLAANVQAQSSNYYPMLQTDASWRIGYMGCGMSISDFHITAADTTINGQTYNIIAPTSDWFGVTNALYVREDVNTKRVYSYSTALQAELLLYDFGLQSGDVFDLQVANWDSTITTFTHHIDSVGQVQVQDGTLRNRIFLTRQATIDYPEAYSYSWIEGIGCDSIGVFDYIPSPWSSLMLCQKVKGTIIWSISQWGDNYCEVPEVVLGIDEATNTNNSDQILQVMPNPANDFWTITINKHQIDQNETLLLYNIEGQLIKTIPCESNRVQINNQDLSAGIYIIKWENKIKQQKASLRLLKGQ